MKCYPRLVADFQVTDSKQSPFSDKLILSHATVVTSFSISSDGYALTNSARKDLVPAYNRLITEMLELAKDCTDLMIENDWLETVPEAADRKKLIQ